MGRTRHLDAKRSAYKVRNLRHYFAPMLRRMPTVRRPYASKYGDQAYVKIQQIAPIFALDQTLVYYMRQDGSAPNRYTAQLTNVNEYIPFTKLYAFFEVIGMKMDVAVNPKSAVATLQMYGGMAPNFVFDPTIPASILPPTKLASMPLQTTCDVQGARSCLYYAFSDDLRKQGAQYAVSTISPGWYPQTQNGMVTLYGTFVGPAPDPTKPVGSVKLTWYVRFTSRTAKPA